MKVYTYSRARQQLARLLEEASREGEVQIERQDGRVYVIMPVAAPPTSPFPNVTRRNPTGVTSKELIRAVRQEGLSRGVKAISSSRLGRTSSRRGPRAKVSVPAATDRQPSMNLHTANASEQAHGVDAQSGDARLRFAITNRRLIQFRYDGNLRLAEPHDYGIQNGRERLLVYQLRGPARTARQTVGWRLLDVEKIEDCVVSDETFTGSRGHLHRQHLVWDLLLARVA